MEQTMKKILCLINVINIIKVSNSELQHTLTRSTINAPTFVEINIQNLKEQSKISHSY